VYVLCFSPQGREETSAVAGRSLNCLMKVEHPLLYGTHTFPYYNLTDAH